MQGRLVPTVIIGGLILIVAAFLFRSMASSFEHDVIKAVSHRQQVVAGQDEPAKPGIVADLIAAVFFDMENSQALINKIQKDVNDGLRDEYFMDKAYT